MDDGESLARPAITAGNRVAGRDPCRGGGERQGVGRDWLEAALRRRLCPTGVLASIESLRAPLDTLLVLADLTPDSLSDEIPALPSPRGGPAKDSHSQARTLG